MKKQKTIEQLATEKRKSIEELSKKKGNEMSKLNTINNTIIFWKVVKENNLNVDNELKTIISLARRMARLKSLYNTDKPLDEIFRLLDQPF